MRISFVTDTWLPETNGVTTVHFTHSGLWDEEAVRSHEHGWGKALDNLERTLEQAHRPR